MKQKINLLLVIFFCCLFLAFAFACNNGEKQAEDEEAETDDDDDTGIDDDDDDDDDDNDNDDDDDSSPGPLALKVMTYNILFDFPNPDYDNWKIRKEHVAEIISFHDADLVGLQEPWPWQITDLHELCPGYASVAIDWNPDSAIFFNEERFELQEYDHFWLSPHPDRISIGFGNLMPRYVMWARLYDNESEKEFYFFNTHFDNTAPFQENAAPLFLDMIETITEAYPVVITGDFNSKPDREAYINLTEGNTPGGFALTNTFDLAPDFDVRLAPDDEREYDPSHRIDHIFIANGQWDCSSWIVDMMRYGDPLRDPSDHFAMAADIELVD